MKKSFLLVILIVITGYFTQAQRQCIENVVLSLGKKEIPLAKRLMDNECFPGNESNADVWLARATVYIQFYEYEQERKKRDQKYVIKSPDALIIANESFYKAIELKPDIKATVGLFDPKEGQLITAEPISLMAAAAMDKKDYLEAIKLLNMVIRSYKVAQRGYTLYLGYAYVDLANCYKALGDEENYKKVLSEATKLGLPLPDLYLNLYDIYKQEKDTVKCGEILVLARKAINDSLAIDVKAYELDYFAMIGDTSKLKKAALKMFEEYRNNPTVISIIATHLINNKDYLLAEELLNAGLAIAPNDFDLNQQMAYRYYNEAADWEVVKDAKLNERPRKFTEAEEALNKANKCLEMGLEWIEKAYKIRQEDMHNNIMYLRTLVRLQKPIPDGLQEKVDSYRKN